MPLFFFLGLSIFSTVSDISLHRSEDDFGGSSVRHPQNWIIKGNWYATLASSTTYYSYVGLVCWQTGQRIKNHLEMINTKWHRSLASAEADYGERSRLPNGHIEENNELKLQRYHTIFNFNIVTLLFLLGSFSSIIGMSVLIAFSQPKEYAIGLGDWMLSIEQLQGLLFLGLAFSNSNALIPPSSPALRQ